MAKVLASLVAVVAMVLALGLCGLGSSGEDPAGVVGVCPVARSMAAATGPRTGLPQVSFRTMALRDINPEPSDSEVSPLGGAVHEPLVVLKVAPAGSGGVSTLSVSGFGVRWVEGVGGAAALLWGTVDERVGIFTMDLRPVEEHRPVAPVCPRV